MKLLFIGDIVARPGRTLVKEILPELIKEHNIDFVIANAENIAHGRGATVETLEEMQAVGVDFFTSGDHIFWHKGFEDEIDKLPIVRPANYAEGTPGKGYAIVDAGKLGSILVVNLMGQVSFGNALVNSPFEKIDEILEATKDQDFSLSLVDFHADATSEKHAFAHYVDGRINAVLGTHTHVPTADPQILPNGTFYITDAGMTGIIDSVLGVEKDIIIRQHLTGRNQRFEWENTGTKAFRSVLLDTQEKTIERLDFTRE